MSEPKPGSVTIGPDGQYYIFFGGVWGKAEGVNTENLQIVDYDSLTIKPEDSFNNAVNQIKNEDNADTEIEEVIPQYELNRQNNNNIKRHIIF